MKQKLIWMLTIALILFLGMPFYPQPAAFASQSGETSTPPTFSITDLDSFKKAVAKIQTLRDESGLTEATLVFTQNLEFDYVPHADVDMSPNYDTQ